MDNFRFDADTHTYYLGDRQLPGVTKIVGDVFGSPQYGTEADMQKGRMVHKALALFLRGNLLSVESRIEGKVEAGKRAIKELSLSGYAFLETPMYHPLYQYAGTPDFFVGDRLVDWKSSHFPTVEPQCGGYVLLAEANHHKIKTCLEIILSDEGTYKMNEYKAVRCRGLFLAFLTVYQWKNGG